MIKFGNDMYYIDFKAIAKVIGEGDEFEAREMVDTETINYFDSDGLITGKQITERKYLKGREFDASKYDILKTMLDVVLYQPYEEVDEKLGIEHALEVQSLQFKIAFNTLLFNKVLVKMNI
jgi:hypothetical protein